MSEFIDTNTIIIGAGAAGLACAACLKRAEIPYTVLEKDAAIGKQWRARYDRLHLHTPRGHSGLPFLKMPASYPRYPSKNEFAEYLGQYARDLGIEPYFEQHVSSVESENNRWRVVTDKHTFHGKNVIIATGYARQPVMQNGFEFTGEIMHSADYKNGAKFRNKKVLVVGFGNSACEIAMCLYEHQAFPTMSVRSGVNIIPRDLAGIPILSIAIAQQWLTKISPRLTDLVNKPVLRLRNGNLSGSGLGKLPYGPIEQIVMHRKIPLIDIGTLALIKKGAIKISPGIKSVGSKEVEFVDGTTASFDAIIFATGYRSALEEFLKHPYLPNENEILLQSPHKGLYFCGFNVSPTGMLREIGREARKITNDIARVKV